MGRNALPDRAARDAADVSGDARLIESRIHDPDTGCPDARSCDAAVADRARLIDAWIPDTGARRTDTDTGRSDARSCDAVVADRARLVDARIPDTGTRRTDSDVSGPARSIHARVARRCGRGEASQ